MRQHRSASVGGMQPFSALARVRELDQRCGEGMRLVGRAGLRSLLGLMVVASTSCAPANAALAFDFFGLFGSDNVPKPSSTTLPYKVEFEARGDEDVKRALQDSSTLHKLAETPPPDGESLALRVKADFAPLIDALWGAGYYNGRVWVDLAGVPLELGRGPEDGQFTFETLELKSPTITGQFAGRA